jgi:hypothetical protein
MRLGWIVACVFMAGCAHGKMGTIDKGLAKASIPPEAKIFVEPITAETADFSGDKAGNESRVGEEKSEIKNRFARLVADELRKKGMNATVVNAPVQSGLVLQGHVTRFEHGSAAARILVGMGAGSSNMYTDFELTNAATKEVLSKFEIIATSGGSGGLQAAGGYIGAHLTDGAEKAADYIAKSNSGQK